MEDEKLREQIEAAIYDWQYGAKIIDSLATTVLNLLKQAGYLPVEEVQLEALGDEEIVKNIAHNEAKGKLYRVKD